MPYGYSQRVWAKIPAQQRTNESENYTRWLNAGEGMTYTLTGPDDHSGSRDVLIEGVSGASRSIEPQSAGLPWPLLAAVGLFALMRRRK